MQQYILAIVLLVTLGVVALRAHGNVEQDIQRLEQEYLDARLKNDVTRVNAMSAPDLFSTNSGGDAVVVGNTRTGNVNTTPGGGAVWQSAVNTDMRIRDYGNVAVATFRRSIKAKADTGEDVAIELRFTDVWARQTDGAWKLTVTHATAID